MTPLAQAVSASKRFGPHAAVDEVSLEVAAGEVVGLLGANGAGKTTLLRLLLGLVAPTAGRVRLFGAPPSRAGRARLGYVAQGLGLYGELTVDEHVAFLAAAYGVAAADVALPDDLAGVRRALVRDLGLGRQRQLAFAAAVAHRPELLVLDEPTSGVNPLARTRLWDRIHEQVERGAGVLVTTHHLQEAQQCDRLVVMAGGRVVVRGTLDEVLAGRSAVVVEAASWPAAFGALDDSGAAVTLAGTSVRVADRSEGEVRSVLERAGVPAAVRVVPATLEETMVLIDGASA